MLSDYFDDSVVFVEHVDEAWVDYRNTTLSPNKRQTALNFLIYAFDIKNYADDMNSLDEILTNLMARRIQKKTENQDYMPYHHSGGYNFLETAKSLTATTRFKESGDPIVQNALVQGELLDVVPKERRMDKLIKETTFLNASQRVDYNLELFNGFFYQKGKLFDSTQAISHKKPGYVAFTLNTNGELSVFNHLEGEIDEQGRRLVHSSMNAGAPVLMAGEMEIKKGQLLTITTYSMHYKPSLFNVARFLEYLSDRRVDLDKTKVLLFHKPSPDTGIRSSIARTMGSAIVWHSIDATDIVFSINSVIRGHLAIVAAYLDSKKTKFKQTLGYHGTLQKVELLNNLVEELTYLLETIQGTTSLFLFQESLNGLDAILSRYQEGYKAICSRGIGRVGAFFEAMRGEVQQMSHRLVGVNEIEEQARISRFKGCN